MVEQVAPVPLEGTPSAAFLRVLHHDLPESLLHVAGYLPAGHITHPERCIVQDDGCEWTT